MLGQGRSWLLVFSGAAMDHERMTFQEATLTQLQRPSAYGVGPVPYPRRFGGKSTVPKVG